MFYMRRYGVELTDAEAKTIGPVKLSEISLLACGTPSEHSRVR